MNEEKIIKHLLKLENKMEKEFEQMEGKRQSDKNEIMTMLDKNTHILQKLDQERIFTQKWIERIEDEVKNQHKEIRHIKKVLEIA